MLQHWRSPQHLFTELECHLHDIVGGKYKCYSSSTGKFFHQIKILIVFSENSEGVVYILNKLTTHTLMGHRWSAAAVCQMW